jgi:hypothetical protein
MLHATYACQSLWIPNFEMHIIAVYLPCDLLTNFPALQVPVMKCTAASTLIKDALDISAPLIILLRLEATVLVTGYYNSQVNSTHKYCHGP